MVYLYHKILFSNKKELTIKTCDYMDKPWKHVNCKKPDTKEHHKIPFIWNVQDKLIHRDRT